MLKWVCEQQKQIRREKKRLEFCVEEGRKSDNEIVNQMFVDSAWQIQRF